mmetsp:Transcript_51237/g.123203  ORF Transcript_51237/g.123203 Transcript_51237/m.123203 type:complete len:230 (-) Transcript_51237:56-745(-)
MVRSTPPMAQSSACCTPGSAPSSWLCRSLSSGSTRVESEARRMSAAAARMRTSLVPSCRLLTHVVCSCGTKGLSSACPLPMSSASVPRMAALTGAAKRSPTMRMSGPVIWMTKGLSASADVSSMASPSASAAASRSCNLTEARPLSSMATSSSSAAAVAAGSWCSGTTSSTSPAASAASGSRSVPSCSMRSARRKPTVSTSMRESQGGETRPICASLRPMRYLPSTRTR